ncbi:MAG: RluA family pseudouridine synthase [Clostridia bacterium]|nr:RluA family pseudouridine synthase [Clostridia bacterium]
MDYRRIAYEIGTEDHGKTVLTFLKAQGFSSRVLSSLKRNPYGITIGRKRVTVQKQLKKGDLLTVRITNKESQVNNEHLQPIPMDLQVLYEDEDVLVLNKPPFLAVHPSMGNREPTLAHGVAHYMMERGREFVFRPIHRLDKNTSGAILLGKNAHSAGVLGEALKENKICRSYLAVLQGSLPQEEGTIDAPIARLPGSAIARCVSETGDRAVTHYRVLGENQGYSLVRLWLDTGRTHQIRVHMAHLGAPVAGDFLYGQEEMLIPRQALHSETLKFIQPVSGEELFFRCPLPADMIRLLEEKEIPYETADI